MKEVDKYDAILTLSIAVYNLLALTKEKCNIFLCHYWYAMPVSEIAARFGTSEGNISVTLNRIRCKIKIYLKERGFEL